MSSVGEKHFLIEKGPGFRSGFSDLGKNLNTKTITAGVVAAIFGCTGPALITINASTTAGYNTAQTVSWLFGIYVFGGLISIIMALYYKMPIVGAYSIPGATMLGAALTGFTFNEAAASFIIAGIIVLILGVTGLIGKVMKWLPQPIVMGMIGGCMLRFGTSIVTSTKESPIICSVALLGFFIIPKLIKKFPPVLAALICGFIALLITGTVNSNAFNNMTYIPPQVVIPHFNVATILSVSVPLAVLVMGAENAQAIGVLYAQSYRPPINAMTIVSGIGGILSGIFGAHNANIAGPMTAICSSEEAGENKEGRYAASIVDGILFVAFGIFASYTIGFVQAIPASLVSILAGLAMINVLINSFQEAFITKKFKIGAFFALIIGTSGISILNIGSAFWALVGGVIISLICEKKDFVMKAEKVN
ncbi:benzoate transporter BenE [Acidilutibacter cellobiosedens]|jgi:benzoate membrane transport protein|uniref:Benzoate transporter BenE n=1 Tax=Acidilutibacter cellobiosedens TaxID=2507161 RepID=A0A410QAS9_9FIRM|nr:benzoate/H(+) symporter BenE family transporter [Acidilutibacter cellobiosedens]MBE6083028.1 benzoate/H(+) symporter BenE family transporter [Tissierellaceae bacterium]QAT61103.1 benzoate transporter BenE [Acidilutibacter cellobiosedens]